MPETPTVLHVTPILRMFDEYKAKQFYLDYLGFRLAWEHRFEPDMPLYMEVVLGALKLHLSEHYGDCTPGSAIRIEIQNLDAFHARLLSQHHAYSRPGIETTPWQTREVRLTDPFGNRLVFFEPSVN
ncbi:glyoxalase superfamily protein [Paenibacillus ferrarius]|uniref:glyoxalase superfamily protein n=1 Tax=Paenibacillus ferrarius TaxID=1469647 RepID=UPI003D27D55C